LGRGTRAPGNRDAPGPRAHHVTFSRYARLWRRSEHDVRVALQVSQFPVMFVITRGPGQRAFLGARRRPLPHKRACPADVAVPVRICRLYVTLSMPVRAPVSDRRACRRGGLGVGPASDARAPIPGGVVICPRWTVDGGARSWFRDSKPGFGTLARHANPLRDEEQRRFPRICGTERACIGPTHRPPVARRPRMGGGRDGKASADPKRQPSPMPRPPGDTQHDHRPALYSEPQRAPRRTAGLVQPRAVRRCSPAER